MSGGITDGTRKVLAIDDLVEALDRRERSQSNVPKVDTFHFNGERVSDWLDLVEQALVGLSDTVKFQRILKYVLHDHHQEVVNAANGNWARFKDGMQRKYRLGDGLLTTADLEAMNKDDFTTVGAFVQDPPTAQGRMVQAVHTRGQTKASASQEPPRKEPEKRKEVVEVEDEEEEDEQDERLCQVEDQRAEQKAKKRRAQEEVEPILRDAVPRKKKYAVRLEEEFDMEKVIDRLLEGHNDLVTLKKILAFAPKLHNELKGRLSRLLVPNVHLSVILPKEAGWVETETKMDWKCVALEWWIWL
ncbi:hypothetical protein CBR_g12543 [Chara braunii]|uniref:Uncharacterized protein n=1 Tax=Chara braunii TaxID=69332 RepID=A0A388JSP6_CHABU|nr:hypothetical protein CBR_g12543 [Chara braunii]|eukprot:GBG60805.1 hypothetical protein CBR_g12543 [Chara braunii]